jgi:RNA polymerase sigma-B factor
MSVTSRAPAHRAEEDRRLFERHRSGRDPHARDQLIERFLPLARTVARRYDRRGEPFEDLMQVAAYGLVKAVDRYDVERGIAFSSYAVPTIVGEIKRHFRDHTWAVRPPRSLQELVLRVDETLARLSEDLRRQPTVEEIATLVDADEEDVLDALQAGRAYRAVSFDAPRGADGEDDAATLAEQTGGEDDGYRIAEAGATLQTLMQAVSDRQREVLRLRFEEDMTQAEIGAILGISQMQVSRILRATLDRMRAEAGELRPVATG